MWSGFVRCGGVTWLCVMGLWFDTRSTAKSALEAEYCSSIA